MKPLSFYRDKLSRASGKRAMFQEQHLEISEDKKWLEQRKIYLEEAQAFLQVVAQDTQSQLKIHIEDIVQLAIDTCFPDRYTFAINFEIKRGKTEARLCFMDGDEEINPMDAAGGGVVDVAAFALRIAAWTLGNTDNVIVLDEPFKFISNDLQPQAAQIVAELSKTLGLQFIIVTHRPEIMEIADKTFEVTLKKEGKYKVSEVIEK